MKINVVGLGPGNIKYISSAGIDCIKEAEILVGSTRQLSDLKSIISEEQEIYILGKLGELVTYLKENIGKKIMASNTTAEATKYIEKKEVYSLLAEKAKQKCEEYCRRNGWELEVETLIISAEKEVLGNSGHFFDNFKRKQK